MGLKKRVQGDLNSITSCENEFNDSVGETRNVVCVSLKMLKLYADHNKTIVIVQ